MSMTEAVNATEPNSSGYRSFSIGAFTFARDEFFVRVAWPTGSHLMSADTFLRALQRDVAWDFFYGTVNFDTVIGTVNHYGTVDMFAGRYNDSYRKAELDFVENFESGLLRETFKAMLDDWTNAEFDPFASPAETGKPFGEKSGSNTKAVTRRRVAAQRMVGIPGDEREGTSPRPQPNKANTTKGVTCTNPTLPRTSPPSRWSPASRARLRRTICLRICHARMSPGTRRWCRCARQVSTAQPRRNTSFRCFTATTESNGSCNCRTRSAGMWKIAIPARSVLLSQ